MLFQALLQQIDNLQGKQIQNKYKIYYYDIHHRATRKKI